MVLASQKAKPHDVSLLMPGEFGEVLLRIYTRETRYVAPTLAPHFPT